MQAGSNKTQSSEKKNQPGKIQPSSTEKESKCTSIIFIAVLYLLYLKTYFYTQYLMFLILLFIFLEIIFLPWMRDVCEKVKKDLKGEQPLPMDSNNKDKVRLIIRLLHGKDLLHAALMPSYYNLSYIFQSTASLLLLYS